MVLIPDATKTEEARVAPGQVVRALHETIHAVELFGLVAVWPGVELSAANISVALRIERIQDGSEIRVPRSQAHFSAEIRLQEGFEERTGDVADADRAGLFIFSA
jgi:hypothetical protein